MSADTHDDREAPNSEQPLLNHNYSPSRRLKIMKDYHEFCNAENDTTKNNGYQPVRESK